MQIHLTLIKPSPPEEKERVKPNSLVFFEISEADEWELVSHKGFGRREGLDVSFIIFYVVKVTGVDVAVELRHHWSHSCNTNRERERLESGGGERGQRRGCDSLDEGKTSTL